jgi:hypothetical protein
MKTLLAVLLTTTAPIAHADTLDANRAQLSDVCFAAIKKVITPAAAMITRDAHAEVTDAGEELQSAGADVNGTPIYFKPLWKVTGNVEGYYHVSAGAYIELTARGCDVVGIKLAPQTF